MTLPETVTALLSSHKSKGKWPDPRASVGDKILFQGLGKKYTCWKAVGPAQELFNNELGPLIRAFLHGCTLSNHEVNVDCYMIGKTKETAAPKVIFSSPDEAVRKSLRKYIAESSIMASDQFTGIQLGDSSDRPGHPIRRTTRQGAAEGEGDYESQDTSEEPGPQVFATKPWVGLGDPLFVRNQSDNSASFTKGTAGPILYWQDKEFCLTVDHMFNSYDASVGDPRQATCSIDGLSDSDSESDIDLEQDGLREASLTSEDDGGISESRSSLDWERGTSSTPNSQGASDTQAQSDALLELHGKGVEHERFPEASDENTSVQPIGTVQLNSAGSSLDYALIDVTGKTARYPNVLCTSAFISSCVSICDFSEIPRHPVDICTVTASSGPLTGVLWPNVTYVRRPNSVAFAPMYEVELHGILANGDSGSAVVDSKSGCFYGLIVAGTPGTGAAFVIPAEEVMQDIERQLGITLSPSNLPKQTATCALELPCQQRTTTFVWPAAAELPARAESVCSEVPSYAESIFSVQSIASTVSTQYSHIDLLPARQNLVDLIANDLVLKPLFTTALRENAAGTERFTRNFYRLLKIYGRELKAEAKSQQHFMAASFVCSQARFIAQGVIYIYESTEDAEDTGPSPSCESSSEYAATDNLEKTMPILQPSDAEDDEAAVQGNLASISELKGFLTSGKPLENLRDSLKDFVHVPIGHSSVNMESATAQPTSSTTSQGFGHAPATSSDKSGSQFVTTGTGTQHVPRRFIQSGPWPNHASLGLESHLTLHPILRLPTTFDAESLLHPQLQTDASLASPGLASSAESPDGPSSFLSPTIPWVDRQSRSSDILVPGIQSHGGYGIPSRISELETEMDAMYKVQKDPNKFFVVGRVFAILWHEPARASATALDYSTVRGKYGALVYSSIRRMVVIKGLSGYAWCCPINNYRGRGVSKSGVDPSEHAVVYFRGEPSTPNPAEPTMHKEPLSIDPATDQEHMSSTSRLRFGGIVSVEHDMKVKPIGMISDESMQKFHDYIREMGVVNRERRQLAKDG